MAVKRQRVIQTAEKLVQKGRLEAAIGEYRKVLREVPNDTRTLNRVGDLYLRLGRVDESVQLFRRAADHFAREGFFVKAIAIYKKVIRVDPTRIQVYESLADLYHRQGLLNEARAQYQVVADYHSQNEDREAVVGIHRKLVALDPEDPAQRLKLADLYQQLDRLSDALEQYRQIAQLMMKHGRIGEATRVYQRAVELDSSDLSFVSDALIGLRDQGNPSAAETLLEVAIRHNPEAERLRGLVGLSPAEQATEAAGKPRAGSPPAQSAGPEAAQASPPARAKPRPEPEEPLVDIRELTQLDEKAPVVDGEPAAPTEADPLMALEFEIELDELEEKPGDAPATPLAAAETAPPVPDEPEAPTFSVPDLQELAPPAPAEDESEEERAALLAEQALELMAEGQVLSAYGLDEKAVERFEQVLTIEPGNLDAYRRLVELHLHADQPDAVIQVFGRARAAVPRASQPDAWRKIEDLVEQEGYTIGGDALSLGTPLPLPLADEAEPGVPPEPAEPVDSSESPGPAAGPLAVEAPPPAEPATAELAERQQPAEREAPPPEESAITWLENLDSDRPDAEAVGEQMFGQEEQFFDLAAELEQELQEEEERLGAPAPPAMEEQSLEEIVEGFKKGVAESLSSEDYDTHYNLGIAYREMGLLDEAIGEFQLAAKDARYLVDCCSLLGASFLEKGFGDLAIKWYRRGLESSEITEEETLGLLYELGNLHAALGNMEEARQAFVEVYGVNSNYRDVVARLEELRAD